MNELSWPETECELPDDVERVIRAAEDLIDQANRKLVVETPAFVPTNFRTLYRHLYSIRATYAPGSRFCEWGSGLGVAAIMADFLGFDSIGIEIDPMLARQSVDLAQTVNSKAQLVQGSFVPSDGERLVDDLDDLFWLHT